MAAELYDRGFEATTVAGIVRRAGVSRRTFYQLFSDRQACLLECYDDAISRIRPAVLAAYSTDGAWQERIRAALNVILGFLDAEPQLARLCVVDVLAAGPRGLDRRRAVLDALATAVRSGRAPGSDEPSPLSAEVLVGGALVAVHTRLLDPEHPPLLGLSSALMSVIVLPYLGAEHARAERERRSPRQPPIRARPQLPAPPAMRVTHRTVRALAAVAGAPGSSNRDIARAASIKDPGQVSKLLSRLSQLGLVRNSRAGGRRGEPNAWQLTDEGCRLLDSISQDARSSARVDRPRTPQG